MTRLDRQVNISKRTSLRRLLILAIVLQILATASVVGGLSAYNGRTAVDDLANQLIAETSDRIYQRIDRYLVAPHRLNALNAQAIESGLLDIHNFDQIGQYFWKQFQSFGVDYVAFGKPNGDYIGAGQLSDRLIVIDEVSQERTGGALYAFDTDEQGERRRVIEVIEQWDHRTEAGYIDTVQGGQAIWSKVYEWQDNSGTLAISAGQPVFNETGQLLGVLTVDRKLKALSTFLSTLSLGEQGRAFILQRDGMLIAASTARDAGEQSDGDPIDPIIDTTIQEILARCGHFDQIQRPLQFSFRYGKQREYLQIEPFQDAYGLDWLIVVMMPATDFMGRINANTRLTFLLMGLAVAIAIGISLRLTRWVVRPILNTVYAVDALSRGEWQQRLPVDRRDELGLLASAFNRMATQLRDSFIKLHDTAYRDALTGLPNRAALMDALTEAIAATRYHPSQRFALLFLDLDGFKFVNDSLGHLTGDCLLVEVAQRIQDPLDDEAIAARFGGDEFAVLLSSVQTITDATQVADSIARSLEEPFRHKDYEIFVGTSIGIVMSTTGGTMPEHFLRDADTALYHAKQAGKGCYEVFDATMHLQTVTRLQLDTDLRHAIERQEFELYYQPICDAQTRELVGVEALVRWQHPSQGMVPPSRFIPIAEETGLIVRIGQWVLEQACKQLAEWRSQFPHMAHLTVSVNLSSRQLLQVNLLEQIHQILDRTGLPPDCLNLEVTENPVMQDIKIAGAKLRHLRNMGIQLSIDDFGTGYSSLSYLQRLPFSTLKIDRMFVQQATHQMESWDIAKTIILLGHRLGMTVVAEGVETEEQARLLQNLGCEYLQGFLLADPMNSGAIADLLRLSL